MNKTSLTIICFLMGWVMAFPIHAQTSRAELLAHMELATGNYCNYPNPSGNVTQPPAGYEPFYVSHYGRHGDRSIFTNIKVVGNDEVITGEIA